MNSVHISVCVCTYKRADLLWNLLEKVAGQTIDASFTYSIVVADNDPSRSAEPVVAEFQRRFTTPIVYCTQPTQNIALTRNTAVRHSTGDYVAFIDDDEFPVERWLSSLLATCSTSNVDGVLGPVMPHFDRAAPPWVAQTGIYDRPRHPTGTVLNWRQTRTGNVLLRRTLFATMPEPFRPEFRSGEDQDFFRRMIDAGHTFVWCDEAVAFEVVPPSRWKRSFVLRRALLRGASSVLHSGRRVVGAAQSFLAAPAYLAVLPLALVFGQGRFMSCLFKLTYHVGRLLAVVGIQPIRDAYVTE